MNNPISRVGKPIDRDLERFRAIVKGKVRKNLRKYLKNDALIGRRGRKAVSIPIPEIELPRFRFGQPGGGVGEGDGEPGDVIGKGDKGGSGGEQGGNMPGQHILEVELSLEELAEMLGEELELPRIEQKKRANLEGTMDRYTSIRRTGPESLRQFRRSYLEALKRMISIGEYDPDDPIIFPIRDDKRYRSWKSYPIPESNAVVFYNRDISYSMDDEKTRLVRLISFWIDTWLHYQYKHVVTRYVVHDTEAAEVDVNDFFHLRISGGTCISSSYKVISRIIDHHYSPVDWNIYLFHFTDGENFSYDDSAAIKVLVENLLPRLNMFCYGQVQCPSSWYGSSFINKINEIPDATNILTARIDTDDDILNSIKIFLGKGL